MSMTWEEIAEARLQEIRRLRAVVRNSTPNQCIIEQATRAYIASRKAFYDSCASKSDSTSIDVREVKRLAEMTTIIDFIADLGVMGSDEFVTMAKSSMEKGNAIMSYDPFLRKDSFVDKPWYNEFQIFCSIGVCPVPDQYVKEIREALARFLYVTRVALGDSPEFSHIVGCGALDCEDMEAYIQSIRGE